ncbi:3-isopropylmalate dehydratase small subunit [Sphingomonas sp.]|uniref:3-isopropylmalate dehydratase small subunit n=1 Tax=Sphingomonas sp. TaxID=28214 RepID=UPI003D6CAAD8
MTPFRHLTAIAAPLPIANIDTDMILSAAFLKTVSRAGLGKGLFHALRVDVDGRERADFILNRTPWREAGILITLDNFGCGSSREHAPWALLDFGIRCIIAPGFADIFHGNCFKNGILPICLPRDTVDLLMAEAADPDTATMTVDLETQTIARHGGVTRFEIDAPRRARLLGGIDDIAQSLAFETAIAEHEDHASAAAPWLADARLDLGR